MDMATVPARLRVSRARARGPRPRDRGDPSGCGGRQGQLRRPRRLVRRRPADPEPGAAARPPQVVQQLPASRRRRHRPAAARRELQRREDDHMTQPQDVDPDGPNPPQFNSLDSDTTGRLDDDRRQRHRVLGDRAELHHLQPVRPRRARTSTSSTASTRSAQRINATAPLVDAVLDGIRARSPLARIFVVNYPAIFPETGYGCFRRCRSPFGDVGYLRDKQQRAERRCSPTQAAANGARLVDWYAASIGHDACKSCRRPAGSSRSSRATGAASLHPNLERDAGRGERARRLVQQSLRKARSRDRGEPQHSPAACDPACAFTTPSAGSERHISHSRGESSRPTSSTSSKPKRS